MLAVIADRHPRGQQLEAELGLLQLLLHQLPAAAEAAERSAVGAGLVAQWLTLALGKLVEDAPQARRASPVCSCSACSGLRKNACVPGSSARRTGAELNACCENTHVGSQLPAAAVHGACFCC